MEKILNHCDKEYMKMAMLKHEETFREQVYELHRLYQIQKILMKDIAGNQPNHHHHHHHHHHHMKQCLNLEQDDDQNSLELTLGPTSYYQKKIKAQARQSDSGPCFSSSSTGSSHIVKQKWGPTQDSLNTSPPWIFQALTLNIT